MRILIFILFFCICSCGKKNETSTVVVEQQTSAFKKEITFEKVQPITPEVQTAVSTWVEYTNLNTFISKFEKASPKQILDNALELRDLVFAAKESPSKPEYFNTPSLKARFSILHNITLRLADMTFIPAIKPEEVIEENKKMLAVYAGINSKLISIVTKLKFEEDIDFSLDYIGIDTTKVDSVSQRTINQTYLDNKDLPKKPIKN